METFSRRSWPAGCACPLLLLSGILRRRSSHSSSALPSCEATRPATAEGLAFWRWVPPAVQGPLRPTSMARGCQEQGSPRSLKRPRAARLVQVDSATTPGLHTRPPAGTADTSPGPEKRRATHPQLAGAEGTGTAKLVATQALRGAKSGDRPRPRAGLGGAGSAPPRGLGLFRAPLPTPLFSLLLLANPGGCRCSLLAALSLGWPHPKCSSDISSLCGHLLKRLQSLATPS